MLGHVSAKGLLNVDSRWVSDQACDDSAEVWSSEDECESHFNSARRVGYADVLDQLKIHHPEDPKAQLLGWAQFIAGRLAADADRGCAFANSVAELPDKCHPARAVIEAHSKDLSERLTALCSQAGIDDPENTANEILFILDGAQLAVQSRGDAEKVGQRLISIVTRMLE